MNAHDSVEREKRMHDTMNRYSLRQVWAIVFGMWVAGQFMRITINGDSITLIETIVAVVGGIVVASAISFATSLRR